MASRNYNYNSTTNYNYRGRYVNSSGTLLKTLFSTTYTSSAYSPGTITLPSGTTKVRLASYSNATAGTNRSIKWTNIKIS